MRELVKIICETLNIRADEKIIVARVASKVAEYSPELQSKFLSYCEKHFAEPSLQYLTGYQKFLELSKSFEKGIVALSAKEDISKAKAQAKELVQKIVNSKAPFEKAILKGIRADFVHIRKQGKERVFSDSDIALLNSVQGDLSSCLHFIDTWGKEELIEKIAKKIELMAISNAKRALLPSKNKMHQKTLKLVQKGIKYA